MILILIFVIAIFIYFLRSKELFTSPQDEGVAIVSTMKNPPNIHYWLDHHRNLGITHFIIRLEDTPDLIPFLASQPDVYLTIGSSKDNPSGYEKEYNSQVARQRNFVKEGIKFCIKKNIKWIAHIDSDELIDLIPGYSKIQEILELEIEKKVYNIIMDNYEVKYDKIGNSCFGKNVVDDSRDADKFINCKLSGKCVSYANGKSIGRVSDKLREHGVHRFTIPNPESGMELNSQMIRVLHFESCDFNNYISKFLHLSKEDKTYPFQFYNESIALAKSDMCKSTANPLCRQKFEELYTKYKI